MVRLNHDISEIRGESCFLVGIGFHPIRIIWNNSDLHIVAERCLVTQISNLTIKAIKKWTIRVGFAVWEA